MSEAFPYEGPPQLRATIADALATVIDPEVALNIVDVGLVYGVTVADDLVTVVITMTSAACPLADVILADIDEALDRALPAGLRVRVQLVWEPPWTAERISPAGRRFMGW